MATYATKSDISSLSEHVGRQASVVSVKRHFNGQLLQFWMMLNFSHLASMKHVFMVFMPGRKFKFTIITSKIKHDVL